MDVLHAKLFHPQQSLKVPSVRFWSDAWWEDSHLQVPCCLFRRVTIEENRCHILRDTGVRQSRDPLDSPCGSGGWPRHNRGFYISSSPFSRLVRCSRLEILMVFLVSNYGHKRANNHERLVQIEVLKHDFQAVLVSTKVLLLESNIYMVVFTVLYIRASGAG